MHDERQQHVRRGRLPRRTADRVEHAVAWTLAAIAVLVVVVAGMDATRLYAAGMHRVEVETRARTQVPAVLLEPAPLVAVPGNRARPVERIAPQVAVGFTARDGSVRRATARVEGPLRAGTVVLVWVDRASGAVTDAPLAPLDAVADAAVGGGGLALVGLAALGAIRVAVRLLALRLALAGWAREWERVAPLWTGG